MVTLNSLFPRPALLQHNVIKSILYIGLVFSIGFTAVNLTQQQWGGAAVTLSMLFFLSLAIANVDRPERHWLVVIGCCIAPSVGVLINVTLQPQYAVYWTFANIMFFYFALPYVRAAIYNGIYIALLIGLVTAFIPVLEAVRVISAHLVCSMFIFVFARHMGLQHERLLHLATNDELTGIPNRRALTQKLEEWLAISDRHHEEIATIAIIDLDLFKRINDEYGHLTGDKVLQEFAQMMKERTRRSDFFARYGGEEFALLMPKTDIHEAVTVMESLKGLISSIPLCHGERISFSAGLAQIRADDTLESWLRRSDRRLYCAKQAGRNTIIADDKVQAIAGGQRKAPATIATGAQ